MSNNNSTVDDRGALVHSDPTALAAFMRLLAHELGNPIASIRMSSEMLVSDMAPDLSQQLSQMILDEAVRLQLLIESAVYYTAINRVSPLTFELEPFLHATIGQIETETPISIRDIDGPREIVADQGQLSRAIREIVMNGVEGGATAIAISAREENGERVITVTDDGEGLDSYRLSKAFEPFYTTREGKLGLGLSIAQRIAELHGGSVDLQPVAPSGTQVTIRIPNNLP